MDEEDLSCRICLVEIDKTHGTVEIPCKHPYCINCFILHMRTDHRCATCRVPIIRETKVVEEPDVTVWSDGIGDGAIIPEDEGIEYMLEDDDDNDDSIDYSMEGFNLTNEEEPTELNESSDIDIISESNRIYRILNSGELFEYREPIRYCLREKILDRFKDSNVEILGAVHICINMIIAILPVDMKYYTWSIIHDTIEIMHDAIDVVSNTSST